MRRIILVFLIVIAIVSCSKEESNPVGKDDDNEYLNGNEKPENSFFPTSKGTWWKFSGIIQNQPTNLGITCKEEMTVDGIYYAKLEMNQNGDIRESFLRVENNEYLNIGFIPVQGIQKEYEMCLLKSDKPVGEKWMEEISISGALNRYDFEIAEKGITKVVKGKTFNDVIVVKIEHSVEFMGSSIKGVDYEMYFAKSTGWILFDYGSFGKLELDDYSIK